jgi:hypothetical protein
MNFKEIQRSGWQIECPYCKKQIRYTLINNNQLPTPFFYADKGNDILLRKSDELKVIEFFKKFDLCNSDPSLELLEKLWNLILKSAPLSPGGGVFRLWENVKCPHCWIKMPHDIQSIDARIYEPKIVLIDGAIICGDSAAESWKVVVENIKK